MRWLILGFVVVGCTGGEPAPFGEFRGKAGGDGALPGLAPLNPALRSAFAEAPPVAQLRTKHRLGSGKPRYTNRLILESSPYLRQHAHNPVNWMPWGDEAFELARRLKRPVLLSVGYSTCHWCHVMEEESFEDLEIASYLNTHYITIKVDREERPDIDGVYMNAVTALSGRGGWPMTVWLTPDKKPFYGATYLPARDGDRGVQHGFLTVLKSVETEYFEDGPDVLATADRLTAALEGTLVPEPAGNGVELARDESIRQTIAHFRKSFDKKWGGLEGPTKFPSSLPVRLLLRYARRAGDPTVGKHAVLTLEKMHAGGMFDHVGGGFHRYSVNPQWMEPHYEKMLYDNALLVLAYLEGYQFTGNPQFANTARRVLAWMDREMVSPSGGLYSAIDADSAKSDGKREEGYFYTWTKPEYEAAVPLELRRLATAAFLLVPQSNGRLTVTQKASAKEVARDLGLTPTSVQSQLATLREALRKERAKRAAPFRDEKILTSWNALGISAYAAASWVLGEPSYLAQAKRTEALLWEKIQKAGRLLRWVGGDQGGFLDDYGFLIAAELDLFEATAEPKYLQRAMVLDEAVNRYFAAPDGGYYRTASDQELVLAREKPSFDGAIPTGNSSLAMSFLRLYQWTSDERFLNQWTGIMKGLGSVLRSNPWAVSELLLSVDFRKDHTKQVVLVIPPGTDPGPMHQVLRQNFFPNQVRIQLKGDRQPASLVKHLPLVRGKKPQGNRVTAYVCEDGVCKLPTTDPKKFRTQLDRKRAL